MKKEREYNKRVSRRAGRVRKSIGGGTAKCPRLSVFRSNVHIYAQLIDDEKGKTLVSASSLEVKEKGKGKIDVAKEVGLKLAEKAKGAKIGTAVFDRGSYRYHGRVKALAEGAREGKLKF